MRRFTITLAFAVLALGVAMPAAATAPDTTQTTLHRSIPNFLACPSFVVHGEFDIDRTTTTFYDQAGTPIRTVQRVRTTGTLSNPLTGKSLPDVGDFKITTDLLAGTRTFTGKLRVDTAPGVGVVFQVVGKLVFDADGSVDFEAGPHDDLDGNLDGLCSYLGGS